MILKITFICYCYGELGDQWEDDCKERKGGCIESSCIEGD